MPEPPIESQLPAGNVGHGLAWSYFYGYLDLILPGETKYENDDKLWEVFKAVISFPCDTCSEYHGEKIRFCCV